MEESSATGVPNMSSLSGQRGTPPKPPKDRKVVTLSAVCLERGWWVRGGMGGEREEGWGTRERGGERMVEGREKRLTNMRCTCGCTIDREIFA